VEEEEEAFQSKRERGKFTQNNAEREGKDHRKHESIFAKTLLFESVSSETLHQFYHTIT
jgi:hypothetical protein